MKKHLILSVMAATLLCATSCDDAFLDRSPKGAVTDATAFNSYESCSA